jgi:uncharacterized membrane protein YfcA
MPHLTLHNAILLFSVAVLGGTINSVAGGGSFLCFPVLLFTGVPPIQANATNTMALWPGTLASVGAYRREYVGENSKLLIPLVCTGLIGGIIGAVTLLHTPQATFLRLIPYLMGVATVLFAISGRVTRFLRSRSSHLQSRSRFAVVGAALLQLDIAVYIGFFGAGAGILMLAMLALLGLESVHTMNAYKTVLATVGNGIAIATFVLAGAILWPQALVMLVGASLGGYGGAYYAQKMNPLHVRWIVIMTGAALTIYFFAKQGF